MQRARSWSLPAAAAATLLALALGRCGDPPTALPPALTGSLRVVVMDTTAIDTIAIALDDSAIGRHRNPHLIPEVVAGVHKVAVQTKGGGSATRLDTVRPGLLTVSKLAVTQEGPFVGQTAPLFTAVSINNDTLRLQQLRGKEVFLAFFEHT